jgi:protein required for attachment to host cells
VVVAGAARARVLMLEPASDDGSAEASELVEVGEITNPMLRARGAGAVSDGGAGRRGGARVPLHGAPEHGDPRRRDIERHFAAEIAEEAAAAWRRYPPCELIVVASAWMLDLLRPAIDQKLGPTDRVGVHELARDLTKVAAAKLHDDLAEAGLLPARGDAPPHRSAPGLPGRG